MVIDALDLLAPDRYGERGVPHDAWTRLREDSPVHWCEPDGFEPFWALSRHADIMEVSSQPDVFANEPGIIVRSDEQIASETSGSPNPLRDMKTIISMDPPEHRDYRKVASGFFTPRGIEQLDEIVETSARALIDGLGTDGEVDIVERIAARHPLRVLATILGLDEEQEERLLVMTQELFGAEDPDLRREGEDHSAARAELGLEFYTMFNDIIGDRRACPRDDLASLLANAEVSEGCPLGDLETFGYYLIVFTAGHDTTRNALSGAFSAFMDHPDQLERLRRDPSLARSAVEEVVRWTSPVNYMKRTAVTDCELNGQRISAGDQLALFYCSANRDADVFDDPFTFDIGRQPNRHLGFGWAEHYCLGAHLARTSMRALLLQLAERVEMMEPAGPAAHTASNFVVGYKSLPVRYRISA